jgi:membrane-associated protein
VIGFRLFAIFGLSVVHLYRAHEYLALFFLLLVEEAGVPLPIPGDTLVALSGAAPHQTLGHVVGALVVSSAGVFVGSSLLYLLMRRGGRPLLAKYGRYLHFSESRLNRVENWFRRHGPVVIIVGRLVPGLRIPTTVMAGLSEVPYRVYGPTSVLAALIWSGIYFVIGVVLHRHRGLFASVFTGLLDDASDWAILAVALGLLLAVASAWYVRRRIRVGRAMASERAG